MRIKTTIERSGLLCSKNATKQFRNQTLKEGLQWVLEFWHRVFLPRHFSSPQIVQARYPGVFTKRTAKYQKRKAARTGQTKVNVYSGETMRAVLGGYTVGGTSKRAWIRLKYPNKSRKGKHGYSAMSQTQIDRELSAINQQEEERMARALGKWLHRKIKDLDKIKDPKERIR